MNRQKLANELKAIGLTDTQVQETIELLFKGTTVSVNMENFSLEVKDLRVSSITTDNELVKVSDLEVSLEGISSSRILSCSIPPIHYSKAELFSVDVTFLPFEP